MSRGENYFSSLLLMREKESLGMKENELYQHFKGGLYRIEGIVVGNLPIELFDSFTDKEKEHFAKTLIAIYDATGANLIERNVMKYAGVYYWSDKGDEMSEFTGVLYRKENDLNGKIFFRTFDNFFELIDREDYPILSRFKRVI